MYSTSFPNTPHDVTTFEVDGLIDLKFLKLNI